jgi:hypothetical protein
MWNLEWMNFKVGEARKVSKVKLGTYTAELSANAVTQLLYWPGQTGGSSLCFYCDRFCSRDFVGSQIGCTQTELPSWSIVFALVHNSFACMSVHLQCCSYSDAMYYIKVDSSTVTFHTSCFCFEPVSSLPLHVSAQRGHLQFIHSFRLRNCCTMLPCHQWTQNT